MLIFPQEVILKTKNMFKKIVSNLSFSPALVGQLGFYAKRLRKEQFTRRLGLVFVALALVVQSLVVFQAPESANASNTSDFVPGGLGTGSSRSLNNFLTPYDMNSKNLKDIFDYFGITRDEITSAQYGSFVTGTQSKIAWGHEPRPGTRPVEITNSAGTVVTTVHGRYMEVNNGPTATIYGWIGHSQKAGWFAIMQVCGNLVTEHFPTPPTPPTPPPAEPAVIELSKTAKNVSQGNVSASTVVAKENDKITFTITAKNSGGTAKEVELKDHLDDVLEYSKLTDKGGGTLNVEKNILSWPNVTLEPGDSESRTFAVQVLSAIPATPTGISDNSSYNCVMENVFGTATVKVPVTCAPPKVVEQVTTELPTTGPAENLAFGVILLAVVTYFYFRSRQLNTEVRLIRRDLNTGTF